MLNNFNHIFVPHQTGSLLEYSGRIDCEIIDNLLLNLKKGKEFALLDKLTARRVYAIIVECLENIMNHSFTGEITKENYPFIYVSKQNRIVLIRTGNLIDSAQKEKLEKKLNLVNESDEDELFRLYELTINTGNKEASAGAGLGLIITRLKSGERIGYSFRPDKNGLYFVELKVSVKKDHMRKLIINRTINSPKVFLDAEKEILEISGESRPPDVSAFNTDILHWFDEYSHILIKSKTDSEAIAFDLDFDYFNSSSAKYILELCKKIASVRSGGKIINVRWHYEEDDTDMLEAGREMSRMAKFPFEFVVKQQNI
jgi:hypothetical protein